MFRSEWKAWWTLSGCFSRSTFSPSLFYSLPRKLTSKDCIISPACTLGQTNGRNQQGKIYRWRDGVFLPAALPASSALVMVTCLNIRHVPPLVVLSSSYRTHRVGLRALLFLPLRLEVEMAFHLSQCLLLSTNRWMINFPAFQPF